MMKFEMMDLEIRNLEMPTVEYTLMMYVTEIQNTKDIKIGCTIFTASKEVEARTYDTYREAQKALMKKPAIKAKYNPQKGAWIVTEYIINEHPKYQCEYAPVCILHLQDGREIDFC